MIKGHKEMPENFICRRCGEPVIDKKQKGTKTNAVGRTDGSEEHIVLVMTPPWQTKMPPLGMAYLDAFLATHGVKTKIIDLNVELFNKAGSDRDCFWDISTIGNYSLPDLASEFVNSFRDEINNFVDSVCKSSSRLIGFSTTVASMNIALYLAGAIKARDSSKVIIIGGPGCFYNTCIIDPNRIIDLFVIGEGEKPLLEIIRRFKNSKSLCALKGIKGTLLCINKKYYNYLAKDPIKNISSYPVPKFKKFNLPSYNKDNPYKPLPVLISRGCINNCSFCVDNKISNPFRLVDPKKVVEGIKFYIHELGVRDIELNDLLCNGNLKHLEQFCDLIIENNINIGWTSYAAIREGMSYRLFQKMKKSGCSYLCYGFESASDKVLRVMNKRYNSVIASRVIRDTSLSGIETAINIIIGHPGDSKTEFRKTCDFVRDNRDYIDQITNISSCSIIPESDLATNPKKYQVYTKLSPKEKLISLVKKDKKIKNDYRRFYSPGGNTPRARNIWMRKFILLINKLQIPYVIINHGKNLDLRFDKFINNLKFNNRVLLQDYIKVDFSQKGRVGIYSKGRKLTKDVGINTSFNYAGKWVDSSSARNKIRKINKNKIVAELNWPDLNMVQRWYFYCKNKYLEWNITTYFEDEARIHQYKLGMMFIRNYDQYCTEGACFNLPNYYTQDWQDILFTKSDNVNFLPQDKNLPCIEANLDSTSQYFLQIQNTPAVLNARMVNFCRLVNNNTYGYNNEGVCFKKGAKLEDTLKLKLVY
jgi:radical SAM superfamily enzyme YgiQ (UPF0313 family)